jgi:hypothetical protein
VQQKKLHRKQNHPTKIMKTMMMMKTKNKSITNKKKNLWPSLILRSIEFRIFFSVYYLLYCCRMTFLFCMWKKKKFEHLKLALVSIFLYTTVSLSFSSICVLLFVLHYSSCCCFHWLQNKVGKKRMMLVIKILFYQMNMRDRNKLTGRVREINELIWLKDGSKEDSF